MNEPHLKPAYWMGGALLAGALAGWCSRPAPSPPSNPTPLASQTAVSSEGAPLPSNAPDVTKPALSNQSENEEFASMDPERQIAVLKKFGSKVGVPLPPSAQLLLAKAASKLSADQSAALLQTLDAPADGPAATELAMRLARLDPQRALELGKQLGESLRGKALLGSAVSEIGKQSAADAVRTVAQLPEDLQKSTLESYTNGIERREAQAGGSLDELLSAIKENPKLFPPNIPWRMSGLVSEFLTQTAKTDPSGALTQVDAIVSAFSKTDASGAAYDQVHFLESILNALRQKDPAAASAFFDKIPENKKTPWMFPMEAISRFRTTGIDAAIGLAEGQDNAEFTKRTASGVWWALVQQDKASALAWIESLPQGPFRQGVLDSVRMNAWMQSMSWGSTRVAVEAGEQLQSKASQMDYYASLLGERRFGPRAPFSNEEIIASLPLSEEDKRELTKRVAPIKPN